MDQTTDQIEARIEKTRAHLGSNLHELEQKVKDVTDWKYHYRSNAPTMLGVAFGGGILLAAMLGPGRRARRPENAERLFSRPTGSELHPPSKLKHEAMETWDHIKGALIGVAASRFTDFVSTVVPGFKEHYYRSGEKSYSSQYVRQ